MSEEGPLRKFDEGLFKDVHFDGIEDNDKVVIVMPVQYLPQTSIPPPEVLDMLARLQKQHPEAEMHLQRLELYDRKPCFVCNQECAVMHNDLQGEGFTRVCWDCMEDQVPGFIERMKAGEYSKGDKLD